MAAHRLKAAYGHDTVTGPCLKSAPISPLIYFWYIFNKLVVIVIRKDSCCQCPCKVLGIRYLRSYYYYVRYSYY